MHIVFSCFIFLLHEIFLACVVFVLYAGCIKNKKQKTKIMCCIILRVDVLWYFVLYFFRAWNVLWYYCVVFPARETCSGVVVLYFSAFHTRKNIVQQLR